MAWKTTTEVIEAVKIGGAVTEDELRYAVRNLSVWQSGLIFPLARAITEEPVSAKTKRDLKRSLDNMRTGNDVPLDVRLKGSSYEPGIGQDESRNRFASSVADTAVKLHDILKAVSGKTSPKEQS